MKILKKLTAIVFAAALSGCLTITAFAAPEESKAAENIDTTAATEESDNSESSKEESDKSRSETTLKSPYSFDDNTVGNAELIASQEIISDDDYYQFIAVKTRSNDVFYIIIDKMKAENNVYFLNEVDTADLITLTGGEEAADDETVKTTKVISNPKETSEEAAEEDTSASEKKSSSSLDTTPLIIGGIVVLGIIAFVIILIKKGGFKKKQPEMPLDDDFDDDDEINEDKE